MIFSRIKIIFALVCVIVSFSGLVDAKKSPAPSDTATIEEINAKQLERLLEEKDYVAVYWCKC
jgi:hypothetical protein